MKDHNNNSNRSIFSVRDDLLINKTDIPPLEMYSEKQNELTEAFLTWLERESLGDSVCYLDLTFEIPQRGYTTLLIVSKNSKSDDYEDIIKAFVKSGSTLYSHDLFQAGFNDFLSGGKDTEQFFVHEIKDDDVVNKFINEPTQETLIKNNANKQPERKTGFEANFAVDEVDLQKILEDATNDKPDFYKVLNSTHITTHWEKWVELLIFNKKSLKSNSGLMLKWILVVPLGILSNEGKYKNTGSIFLGMDSKCTRDDVIYFTRSLILLVLSSSQRFYAKLALKSSIKSAVASIMSRNMSHNLGSHVLSNLKGELDDIGNLFKNTLDDSNCNIPFKSKHLFGLKWFINYLQERQDFIATVGGFENQTFMPVNFKTFVFDGLLPDHQYQRHQTNQNLNAHKNYLLEYIIKSENVKRDRIIIKFKSFDSSEHTKSTINDYKELTQLNVSFPGGIVGRQAFFSIFENIIRNAAKHCEIKGNLEIKLDTPDDGNYDANEYIKFTITDNLGTFKTAHSKISMALSEPIFDDNTEKQENKGIKEMKISAAWLRGIQLEDIDNYKEEIDNDGIIKRPNILTISESEDSSLQYVFYLLKPKELVIYLTNVDDIVLNISDDELISFNKFGIDIISPEYFQNRRNYNLRHSLFVIQQENEILHNKNKKDGNIQKYFNQRRLDIPTKTLVEIIQKHRTEPEGLITAFWKIYLKLDQNPTPFIDFRPVKVEDTYKFEKFRTIINSDPKKYKFRDINLLFNHHNDSERTFNQFRSEKPELFSGLHFLEGISGGNSTEQLTSRIEKSELFFYKLLESCVADVVILDERLWNTNSKTDITEVSRILNGPLFNQDMLDEINMIEDVDEWAKKILTKLEIPESDLSTIKTYFRARFEKFFLDTIMNSFDSKTVQKSIDVCKKENDYKYWLYRKKNVEIVNIIFNKTKENQFCFYNLNFDNIGEYTMENNLKLNLSLNKYSHKIISIHQGIIDKIQNFLKIENGKNNDRNGSKDAITIINEALPENFIKVIHSGRGKPSVEIPHGFHFVPYASLESAFYDCKFSLTDLLFNAKSESS
jgi:signal transduction histidine kinase